MDTILHTPGRLEFVDRLTAFHRITLAVMGLLPLYVPYALVLRSGLPEGGAPLPWIPLLISLGAVAVFLLFLAAALFGIDQRVVIDAATGAVIHMRRSALIGARTVRHPFASIEGMDIAAREWSDGPPTYNIAIAIPERGGIEFGRFPEREEAERYLAEIRTLTGR
ncbi:MAG: hypothetical protein ACYC7L_15915 [Nitrospirota bacterium]